MFLEEDWHVHSTFSDGSATVSQNVRAAEELGLRSLCLVDQVRGTTNWISELVATCRAAARGAAVQVHCGVEAKAVEWLVRAAANAVQRHDRVILARPFSILPRLGLDEDALHRPFARWLATVMARRQAGAEISERWRSPAPWVTECFLAAGVTVHAATDSRSPEDLGRYAWCRRVAEDLAPALTPAPVAHAA